MGAPWISEGFGSGAAHTWGCPAWGAAAAGEQGREWAGAQGLARRSPDCPGACVPREISAEAEREPQQLQNYWSEVRYTVRCIYRQAGTPLADDQDQSLVPDKEGVKELVDRYSLPGPGPSRSPPVLSGPLSGSASGTWWRQMGRVKAPVLIPLDACCLQAEGERTCSHHSLALRSAVGCVWALAGPRVVGSVPWSLLFCCLMEERR